MCVLLRLRVCLRLSGVARAGLSGMETLYYSRGATNSASKEAVVDFTDEVQEVISVYMLGKFLLERFV